MGGNVHRARSRRRAVVVIVAATVAAGLGLAGSSGSAGANVEGPAAAQALCSAPAWSASAYYNQGSVVSHRGHEWRASSWLWPGVEPGISGAPPWWVPWQDLGACGPGTTTTTTPGSTTTSTTTPASTTTTTTPPDPGDGVEEHFAAGGPAPITTAQASDAAGTYTLVYPANFAGDAVDNAILS
jgi:hypothetical protein